MNLSLQRYIPTGANIDSLLDKTSGIVFPPSADPTDPKQSFKKVVDEFVVEEMFGNTTKKMAFLKLVADKFNYMINEYIKNYGLKREDILFIYKGGNVLRMHFNVHVAKYPKEFGDCFRDIFSPNFSKSDDDFTIYINLNIPKYQTVYDDIVYKTYIVLDEIKKELSDDKEKYFSLYEKNPAEINQIICDKLFKPLAKEVAANKDVNVYINSMNDREIMKTHIGDEGNPYSNYTLDGIVFDQKICDPKGDIMRFMNYTPFGNDEKLQSTAITSQRNDFGIVNDGANHVIHPFKNVTLSDLIYLTFNDTLDFTKETGTKSSFALLRAKINCVMYMSNEFTRAKNKVVTAGELIDISIPKSNDDGIMQFYEKIKTHPNDELVTPIQFISPDGNTFTMLCYSVEYMIYDLQRMLFSDLFFPWRDVKYVKRIKRLWCLYFIKLIMDRNDKAEKIFIRIYQYLAEDDLDGLRQNADINDVSVLKDFVNNYFETREKSWSYLGGINNDFKKYRLETMEIIKQMIYCFRTHDTVPDLYSREERRITVEYLGGKYAKYKTRYLESKEEIDKLKRLIK